MVEISKRDGIYPAEWMLRCALIMSDDCITRYRSVKADKNCELFGFKVQV